jgi:hypothetical protein
MKTRTSRFESTGGWVGFAFLCLATACGSNDDGGGTTPPPDASDDVASDTPPRMDVSPETGGGGSGGNDARSDAVDAPSVADARDAADAGGDRVVLDVPSGSDADATIDTTPPDDVVDVVITPPTAFTITGISGPTDTAADAWLAGTPTPAVQWQASPNALGYDVTVYEDDGTTVKCATQQVMGNATTASFPSCTLTEGWQYRASVVATAGTFRTAATNDKFRFAVGAVVFGQPDGKSNEGLRLGLDAPQDVIIVGTKLVVADQNNSRVLIWNTIPMSNHKQADIVLGQPNFTTNAPNYGGIGPATFSGSNGVASDGTKLVVGDRNNHRVLIWNTFPTTNNQPADVVVGQPNFTSNTSNNGGVLATSMTEPWVWLGGGKLFVSDRANHRVLIWNSIPTQNPAPPADVVLGQSNMMSNTANSGGVDESAISDPGRGWVDGTRLLLPDYANHRVLIWNTLPTMNEASADLVLGQSSMNQNSPNMSGTVGLAGLNGPLGVYASGNTIAVADYLNNRVAVWTSPITSNGQSATLILGQTTTSGSTANTGGISASSAFNPCSVGGDGTKLVIADQYNHRIQIFPAVPTMTGAPASFVVGQPDTVSNRPNNAGSISASSLTGPNGVSMLGTRFGITDNAAARALIWDAPPTSRSDLPKTVLGQPNFTSWGQFGGIATPTSLCAPSGLHSDGTRLFIGEQCANRATMWNTLPTLTQQPADFAIGQPDLVTSSQNTNGVSAHSMLGRASPHSDGTHLFVADTGNNRVLIWNTMPAMNGKDADVALGQPNRNSNTANNGGISPASLSHPFAAYVSGTKLVVSDASNNRVLIWNAIPTLDGKDADVVLGQPDMMAGAAATTPTSKSLNGPTALHVDASGRLYVTEPANHRILYWNAIPTSNYVAADGVIGQPNLDVGIPNNGGIGARTLQSPGAVLSSGTNLLYVLDSGNDRMLLMPRP